jgi:menaquinone-dependent protoporphyrinogen oxidase
VVADPAMPLDGPARVLVTYASRMGSTAEIGEAIAERLRAAGLDVTVVPVGQAPEPEGFDAVVCGSAIYATRWDKAARHYIRQHRQALAERPTWLFESGPCGDSAGQRHQTSPSVLRLAEDIGSSPPQVFGGNLDPARRRLSPGGWPAATWPATTGTGTRSGTGRTESADRSPNGRPAEALRPWGQAGYI